MKRVAKPRPGVAALVRTGRRAAVAGCCVGIALAANLAQAQRGRFDQVPTNPVDEAYIFTPRGFAREGKPAVAAGQNAARLHVVITDGATGEPTFCRVNVVGADGNYYQPADHPLAAYSLTGNWPDTLAGNRVSKAPIRYFGRFFYASGEFTVDVPAGPVRVEVWKGFEFRPEARSLDLPRGATGDLKLSLKRVAPMAQQGWYSGDPHLHFVRGGDADEKTIFDLLAAEDIRLGMVLAYNETNAYPGVMETLETPQLRGLGSASIAARGDVQILSGQEYRNVALGHILLYLRDSLALAGRELDPNLGPPFGTIGAETQQLGGYAFHAHGGYAQEIWADLVLGSTNGVELLQFGIYRGIGLEGWYHALNCGFRFPGLGASDYPACRKLGDCRTYAHVDGEPTFAAWLAAAADGRSFMTSGPLLLLEVDGKRPGDTITTADNEPRSLPARVEVHAPTAPVTDVQLVVNGRVVYEEKLRPLPDEPQHLVLERAIEIDRPSWIAARAFSRAPSGSPDAEAHTNPVYVYRNGRRPFSADDARWLVERLDEQIADHQARDVPQKQAHVDYFRQARERLLQIAEQGGLPAAAGGAAPTDAQTKPALPRGERALAEFLERVPAKPPQEALGTFEVQEGFRMELVAAEPDVTDPVAACFDENGGLYVAEMIDYPYRPKEGQQPLGRVRYLQDTDGDGRYESSTIFAAQLAWPTGVACWKGGVYVAAAPDIWYLRDTDNDHVADERRVVFTGFGDRNQQGTLNNLAWGVDHKIYGSGSTNGGRIRAAGDTAAPIELSGHDFRFDPATGTFETITGQKQFGNAFDDWFRRFLCSESKPLYHVVLPQHYLARNPFLAVSGGLQDLAPGVTPIFRSSPVERWRQIRSGRRLAAGERSPGAAGLSHDVIDAAAGLTVYRGAAYGDAFRDNVFVGCSQNNLIHRRKLIAEGVTFRSERADRGTEFVRSTDTWFRPVNCVAAPDGTLFVLDMSREVIESIHIAGDVVAHLDLTSGRDRGRIYRLAPPQFVAPPPPALGSAPSAELARHLEHADGWWRDTAARLLYERQDGSIVGLLRARLRDSPSAVGRMHIAWTLVGLGALADDDLRAVLADSSPRVREHAAQLAAPRLKASPELIAPLLALASDDDPGVRFQAAFALGETDDPGAIEALAAIARRDAADSWMRTAVLSSCAERGGALLARLAADAGFVAHAAAGAWLEQAATIVGARGDAQEVQRVLSLAADLVPGSTAQQVVVVGLGTGLNRSGQTLWDVKAGASAAAAGMLVELVERAVRAAHSTAAAADARVAAVRLLGTSGSGQTVPALLKLIDPSQSEALQLAVLQTLARFDDDTIAAGLIAAWPQATPRLQEALVATLAARPAWAREMLDACSAGPLSIGQVGPATRDALLEHADDDVRSRARQAFADLATRGDAIGAYQQALALPGDPARGEAVFESQCTACHRLGERGYQVGPNLALVRSRSDGALLEAILDPNREVQPSYVNYLVVDDSGRSITGLIVAETATSLTLARDKGASETILKKNIEAIKNTGKSLMPEGLEKNISLEAMADLLAFLRQVHYDVGTLPDFAEPEDP